MTATLNDTHVARRNALWAAWAVWSTAVLGWLALMAFTYWQTSDLACPPGDQSSTYGTATWSWMPPGITCTWDLASLGLPYDLVIVEHPPVSRLGIIILFVLWGATIALLGRALRSVSRP